MKKKIPEQLFNKFLKGECTPDEEAAVRAWYNSFENDPDHISSLSYPEMELLKDKMFAEILRNTAVESKYSFQSEETQMVSRGKSQFYILGGIAAVIVFLVIVFNRNTHTPVVQDELVNVINNTKTISEQILSDGTKVWVSPGSTISYPKRFSGNTREIKMKGESFFEVTKNPHKPFIIISPNLVTKVWGTSFRVRDDKVFAFADVTVMTGKVSVKLKSTAHLIAASHNIVDSTEVMLYPSQQAVFVKQQHTMEAVAHADMQELHIWRKMNLTFDNGNLKDVITLLNKQFDVEIVTADDTLNSYTLNADFTGLNLPEIMDILKKTLNINYQITGNRILISRNQ